VGASRFLFLALAAGMAVVLAAQADTVVRPLPLSEEFESLTAGLPDGWVNQSAGELVVRLGQETRRPHSGKAAWRIDVPVWDAGAAHVRRGGVPLTRGTHFAIEVWLRGERLTTPVQLSLERADGAATYLSRRCAVGAEWRRFILQGAVPTDDSSAALAIRLPGSGTLSVDSLRIAEGEPSPASEGEPPAPAKGNRVYNSSFEVGTEGWTLAEKIGVTEGESPDGRQFARWIANPLPLECRPFTARPGVPYTFSASLRSSRPGARIRVQAVEVGGGPKVGQTFDVTSDWQRYSFTAALPCDRYARYFLVIGPEEQPYGFDVDAVQVEEGPLSGYAPAAAIEIATGLSRAALFPRPDEAVTVPVRVSAPGGVPAGALLRYRAEGFYGETLGYGEQPLKTGEAAPLRLRPTGSGTVRLTLDAVSDGRVISSAEALLTALPPVPNRPQPESFFGAHGTIGTSGEWHAPTVAARAGVRWWRLHDLTGLTHWPSVEPQPGRFIWFDPAVDALRTRGLTLLGVLGRTPGWAGTNPGGGADRSAWPPASSDAVARYARRVAEHYRGRIAAYELWNEPWSRASWAGTPEKYADVARAMAEAVRTGDPAALRIGGCFWYPRPEFTTRVMAREFASAVDGVSHHQYTDPAAVAFLEGGRDQVSRWAQGVRSRVDVGGGSRLELWNTEGGVGCPSFYGWLGAEEQARAAARALAKTLILNRATGVRRYFYYHVWQENGSARLFDSLYTNNWSLLDFDGSGKPTLSAYAGCAANLEGASPVGRVESQALKAYVFRKGNGGVVALWSPAALGAPRELELPISPLLVTGANLMNNRVGIAAAATRSRVTVRNEPLYLHVRGMAAGALLAAVQKAKWVSAKV
jgi:hypothetical protein